MLCSTTLCCLYTDPLSPLYGPSSSTETSEERKPEFLVLPTAVTKVVDTGVLLLPCAATGFPTPSVRWMLNDKVLDER